MTSCTTPSESCKLARVFSKKLGLWIHKCVCGEAFHDMQDGTPGLRLKEPADPSIKCLKCGSSMSLVRGRNGPFFACDASSCKATRPAALSPLMAGLEDRVLVTKK